MEQRTSDRNAGVTTEFERDVFLLLRDAMRTVDKQERTDVGTESVLSALVSGDWDAGSAIAPGMRASGSLAGSIAGRITSVWVSADADDGETGPPDDERQIDAFWRELRHEEAKRLRWKHRKKEESELAEFDIPPMTGALRSCLRRALAAARDEGTVSVRVRHVARALLAVPDTRAREALVLGKLDAAAAGTALDALRGSDDIPEPGSVLVLRKAGTFGKTGNPLTRKFNFWVLGGGAGFGSAVVSVARSEGLRSAVRRGKSQVEPIDLVQGILALDRALTVADRELPDNLAEPNRGAELLHRYGARHEALTRFLLPADGVVEGLPPEISDTPDFARRVLHVSELTATTEGASSVGTTHLLAALLDETGTDAESAAEVERVLTECGVDVAGLRAEPALSVPRGAGRTG